MADLELVLGLSFPVWIELGKTMMSISEIEKLERGSVIEFEKNLVDKPVSLIVNGKKIAEGDVVTIKNKFGLRITSFVN